jgi:2-dehydro-3-deoxyphosphogluconate aldolase/(4S)-4-hydroxy-2-oxoglutarate aldolase
MLGAGTVTTIARLKDALAAGATFIVMPTIEKDIIKYCKVFPSKFFGPEYFKEIKGPFNEVKLLACGGVTPENMQDYFDCGADAVSFGASVFCQQWLEEKNWAAIKKSVLQFLSRL